MAGVTRCELCNAPAVVSNRRPNPSGLTSQIRTDECVKHAMLADEEWLALWKKLHGGS